MTQDAAASTPGRSAARKQPSASCLHTCFRHQAVLFGTSDKTAMSSAGKVTVGLAMCHRLKWFIHLCAQDLSASKEDDHPINTLYLVTAILAGYT